MSEPVRTISAEMFYFLQSMGSRYEGYVEGIGYASSEPVTEVSNRPPYPHDKSLNYNNKDRFTTTRYVTVIVPILYDSRYDRITPEDVKRSIVRHYADGSMSVNRGNNRRVDLPAGSQVEVTIREEFFADRLQKVVTITTENSKTKAQTQDKFPLLSIATILKDDHLSTLKTTGDRTIPEIPSPAGGNIDWGDVLDASGRTLTCAGTAASVAQAMTYNKTLGIWMGQNHRLYNHRFYGNKTAGSIKAAKVKARGIGYLGYGFSFLGAVVIITQYFKGDISKKTALIEGTSLGISTFSGIYGISWAIGWEGGRAITQERWYQEWKFNFWYKYWEDKMGPPSESNRELWRYFYENYEY